SRSIRRNRAKPGSSSGHRSRSSDEDSVRGPHQGQQSTRTASTGRTHDCKRPLRCTPNDLLPGGGHPHMKRRVHLALGLVGPVLGWADRKVTSDCAYEVILSLKGAKSPTRGRKLRSTRTKVRARVSNGPNSLIELKKRLEAHTRELAEALEQQTATSEG